MTRPNINLNFNVTFRHTESTPALKTYAIDKVDHCVRKYLTHDGDIKVILAVEKRDHSVEVVLHSKGHEATATASTHDLYSAVDKVVDALEAQLRKQKDKNTQHHKQVAAEF